MTLLFRLTMPGAQQGRFRYEYACQECKARTLDRYPSTMRVEAVVNPRPDTRCPDCGKAIT